jgi:hypothetical protein
MNAQSTIVDTKEGQAHVSTKSRWLYLFPMPHTGVMPYPCGATHLKQLATFIKWTTDDPAVLAKLHESICRLVQEVGVSGLVEIANSARMTERVWKTFGGARPGLQEMVEMAAKDGVAFPMPREVLKYLKGFQ